MNPESFCSAFGVYQCLSCPGLLKLNQVCYVDFFVFAPHPEGECHLVFDYQFAFLQTVFGVAVHLDDKAIIHKVGIILRVEDIGTDELF